MWLDDVAHSFSHYHLTLRPRLHRVTNPATRISDDASTWATRDDLASMGIPAPVRTLLHRILED